jgi:ribonuclease BN (tRNA processing enzyme)
VSPVDLDAVVLSHSHPDHWLDVPVLRNALKYVLDSPAAIDLYGTEETLTFAEQLCSGGLAPTFTPHVISDRAEFSVGAISWRCSRTDHPVETMGLRAEFDGRAVGYSADTGPRWSVGELGALDLAISEATYLAVDEPDEPVHLSARQAGELAGGAGARRLALTHLLPGSSVDEAVAEASDAYGAPVEVAAMHHTFTI